MKRLSLLIAVSIIGAVGGPRVTAADHDNLDEHLPTSVQDAYPLAWRAFEAQMAIGYREPDDDDGGVVILPRLEIGALPNLQVGVGAEFITDGDRHHSGDVIVSGLYGFTQESLLLPGLALAVDLALPTGQDSDGLRGKALAVLTKGLVPWWTDRWHVNAGWELLEDAGTDERSDRFMLILGWSRPLGSGTVLVLDGIREQGAGSGSPWESAFEIGLRRQLTPLTVASLGAGVFFVDHEGYDRGQVLMGLQRSF